MKKNVKLTSLAVGAMVALCAGAFCLNTTPTKAEEATPDFYIRGAAVRFAQTEENSGIRFSVLMEKSKYQAMIAEENAKMGVYLIPQDLLVDANENGWDEADFVNAENAVFVDETKNIWFESEVDGYMEALAYIYDFPAGSYNRPISAVAYANGEFTESVERSFAGVALAAVNAGEVDREVVSVYLSQEYTVQFIDDGTITGTEGAVLDSATYTYGEEIVVPQIPEVFGKTFLGAYARVGTSEGEAVWSETLTTELSGRVVRGNMQFKVSYGDFIRYAGVGMQDAYKIGDFVIAKTDFAKGTVVDVTMQLKYSGKMFTNKWLWVRYTDANGSMEALTEPSSAADNYKEFTEVAFTTLVGENGEISIEVRNANGGKAEYCVEVKDVAVVEHEEVLKYAGTGAANAYKIGDFVIANTDFAKGTVVDVTMQLKYSGQMFTNKWLWARYTDANGSMEALTQPDGSASVYKEFTEVTFTTLVGENGEISIEVRNANGGKAAYCVEVKGVVVVEQEKILKYEGTGAQNAYKIGDFVIANTDYAEGTLVSVTMQLKYSGKMFTNKWLWARYTDANGSMEALTEPSSQAVVDTYKEFTEVTFATLVGANGQIALEIRNANGGSAAYCVEVKGVVVEPVLQFKGSNGGYDLGDFVIADTDYAEGTFVNVTLEIKLSGAMFTNKQLWTRYMCGANDWEQLTGPGAQDCASFVQKTFKAYVAADGKIILDVRSANSAAAAYCVQVKNVQITKA